MFLFFTKFVMSLLTSSTSSISSVSTAVTPAVRDSPGIALLAALYHYVCEVPCVVPGHCGERSHVPTFPHTVIHHPNLDAAHKRSLSPSKQSVPSRSRLYRQVFLSLRPPRFLSWVYREKKAYQTQNQKKREKDRRAARRRRV